ncbi:MAG: helix-hairpin-helix domain-containing protein [Lentisphaeria bacterium]|nr:helix-hairpin-helix domain-containing protein [Lentisphaeria bacterium]
MDLSPLKKLTLPELEQLIEHHNRAYWELNAPEISDDEYDVLLQELRLRVSDHPLLEHLGAVEVMGAGKVHHLTPMLSLAKAYSLEEVLQWVEKFARSPEELLLVEPKYDGISANFDRNGVLATRGDGADGEDITDKLPLIELETADYTGKLDRPARGEIVIREDDFANLYSKIIKQGGGHYKNSRNAVAGIVGLKDISAMLQQHAKLTLVDYEKISFQVKCRELKNQWNDLVESIESLPYPMDGIVIKLADKSYAESLGVTAHHPRGEIAFKFSGVRKKTRLLNVIWSFGKNNLTPVAEIEPVEIGGVTIRHASLHNYQNIVKKDIQINDYVYVERAGDVIPYIVSAEPGENRRSALIEYCPSAECHTKLVVRGPELCCPNKDCFESRLQRLTSAVKNLGIEQLGEPTVRNMMRQLQVRTLHDVLSLSKPQLLTLDKFKELKADKLLKELAAAKKVNDYQLLASLNIPFVGINVAKVILKHYPLPELRNASLEDLAQIPGVGPERAKSIRRVLSEEADYIDELLGSVELIASGGGAADLPKICFTGKMPEKRSYYETLAGEYGFQAVDTVSGDLALLISADAENSGSKVKKAEKLGIKIMLLDDFMEQVKSGKIFEDAPVATLATPMDKNCDSIENIAPQPNTERGAEQLKLGF